VERVLIDVWVGFFASDVDNLASLAAFDVPHWRWSTTHQNRKHAYKVGIVWQMLSGDQVFSLSPPTVDQGDATTLSIRSHSTAEATGKTHQMGII